MDAQQAVDTLQECGGNVAAAARRLGLARTTFRHHLAQARALNLQPFVRFSPQRLGLNVENGIVLVFGDAHYWPGEASTAHRALVAAIKKLRPRAVINNGDALDGCRISRHPRSGWMHTPSLKQEIDATKERLGEIEEACVGYSHLIWNFGNHDQRFANYLAAHASEFEGLPGTTLEEHFRLWRFAESTDINPDCIDGRTVVMHNWKGGIHATYNNAKDSGVHFVTAHLHKQECKPHTNMWGTRYGIDPGCLAEVDGPHAYYTGNRPTGWRSGFAVLTYREGRLLHPEFVTVVEPGRVSFRGVVYDV